MSEVVTSEAIGGNESISTENNNEGNGVSALHDLIAGGVAGSASVIVGHPFDTIKVRLQTSSASATSGSSFQSLFKGMGAPLCTAAIVNAIIFASYGSCTRLWEDYFEGGTHHEDNESHGMITGEGAVFIEHGQHHHHHHEMNKDGDKMSKNLNDHYDNRIRIDSELLQQTEQHIDNKGAEKRIGEAQRGSDPINNTFKVFMCGAAAGTAQAIVICPMEHIKCRLQVNTQQIYKGPLDACTSIIKNHGLFRGLYRGMGVTLWRETPAFGMYFATYDTIKDRVESLLEEKDEKHPIPSHAHAWAASALAGGISGAWTWAIIYPFDVIKSRIQTGPLETHLRKGMWRVAYDLVNEHGWRYMFRGLGVTLARAFPVNAIIFPVYEFVLIQLGESEEEAVENTYVANPNPSK